MVTGTIQRTLEVLYITGDDRFNQQKKTYHYFVPPSIKGDIRPDDLVVVQGGTGDQLHLAKVIVVTGDPERARLCTRKIIAVVDISHHIREQAEIERRREVVARLTELDRKRQEQARFAALAEGNTEAAALLTELQALDRDAI